MNDRGRGCSAQKGHLCNRCTACAEKEQTVGGSSRASPQNLLCVAGSRGSGSVVVLHELSALRVMHGLGVALSPKGP